MRTIGDKIIVKAVPYKVSKVIKVKDEEQYATVIATGNETTIKTGDTVLVPKYQGVKFKYLDDTLLCIRESDVLLAVKGEII